MAFFEWSENYNLGIVDIDNQHKKLVLMINDLHDAMKSGKAADILGTLLAGLRNYNMTHFTNEEKYMMRFRYPKYAEHKGEHEVFIEKISEFQKRFASGNAAITVELMNFLKDWLTKHILGTDKEYVPFFAQSGVNVT